MREKVGLVGLGNAGLALATPIARKYEVVGYDIEPSRRELAAGSGVVIACDARSVAQQCEVVMLCLPNPEISARVLSEIGAEALSRRLIIENSTVGPEHIQALVELAAPAGASVIECAILGGVHRLAIGKGTFLVGGSETDFSRAKPVLESAAEKIFFLGPLGNGMRTKLVCNAVAHAVMVVLVEAAALAAAQEIPMDVFYELMQRESGLMRPLTHRFAERIFKSNFAGGMSTANARKDSALALGVAAELGVPMFAIPAAHTVYEIALGEGLGREDYSAIATLWEKWMGCALQQETRVSERREIPPAFYEYLDHLASAELKARSVLQGSTRMRYEAARRKQGGLPLSSVAAESVISALGPGAVVLLTTGTGNAVWLPRGETDGPSGIAVLARVFANLRHRVCVLSEKHYLPGIVAAVEAAGVPTLDEASWRERSFGMLAVEFPLGRAAAESFVDPFLDRMPEAALALFVEKPGPNVKGVFHNSSGKPKPPESLGHLNWLAERCRARGIATGAVGDGGNEIGFGAVQSELADSHPYGRECGCPCGHGIIDATAVDFLFPAAVSNWGGYAIAAAVAVSLGSTDLLPDLSEVEASIRAPLAHGAFDGYSGMRVPTVDGTSLEANKAVYQLMLEVTRLAAA